MNDVATPLTFQDRIKERIKKDFAEMVTDEEMTNLVTTALNSSLLEPYAVHEWVKDSYGSHKNQKVTEYPSLMQEAVRDVALPFVKDAVHKWVRDNPDAIRIEIEKAFGKSAEELMQKTIKSLFGSVFQTQHSAIYNELMLIQQKLNS